MRQQEVVQRVIPQFPHKPDIGVNAFHPVEGNKEEFFTRLYDHRHKQAAIASVNAHKAFVREMGRDVHEDPFLDAKATETLIKR